MTAHFGLWNFAGAPVTPAQLSRVKSILGRLSARTLTEVSDTEICFLHQPTGGESRTAQPFRSKSGCLLCWDGRLDNRAELREMLGSGDQQTGSDAELVAAACDRWGTLAFRKLIGDWSLALWNPRDRTLILAKDFLGSKPLYFQANASSLRWSNLLDPLALASSTRPALDEEYLAGWFARFPATHLTPYVGIHTVPPSSYFVFRDGQPLQQTHWEFDSGKRILYRNPADYEEQFREVFARSVARRLRSRTPVLAELSGGMDSSSIVCMADRILSQGQAEAPRLDTISYFDDSEPNWDERSFFRIVEERRGRTGLHILVNFHDNLHPQFPTDRFAATPAAGTSLGGRDSNSGGVRSGAYEVLLQGIGGDEVLGGIPAASPELADLLASLKWRVFTRSLLAWALAMRVPVTHLASEAVRELLSLPPRPNLLCVFPWLQPEFVRRNRDALEGYERNPRRGVKGRPSFRANLAALEDLRRHVGCLTAASATENLERRYPYLDRDLLEFIYAIPRDEVIRPHERRSLMRRALRGVVPEEILNRKRKAFISRGPVVALRADLEALLQDTSHMLLSDLGVVKAAKLQQSLKQAAEGQAIPVLPLLRAILLEAWLRHISEWTACRLSLLSAWALPSCLYLPRENDSFS